MAAIMIDVLCCTSNIIRHVLLDTHLVKLSKIQNLTDFISVSYHYRRFLAKKMSKTCHGTLLVL